MGDKSERKTFHSKRIRNAVSFVIVCAAVGGGMRGNMIHEAYLQEGIDLKRLLLCFVKKLWLVIGITFIGAVAGSAIYLVAYGIQNKTVMYQASSQYHITFDKNEDGSVVDYYNAYTWNDVLKADPIVKYAMNFLPEDLTEDRVREAVSAEMLGDYRFLTVKITTDTPELSNLIASAYKESLRQFASSVDGFQAIELWRNEMAQQVIEKSKVANAAILGALTAGILAVLTVLFLIVLDDSVYTETDFSKRYPQYPVLGILTRKKNEKWIAVLRENAKYLLNHHNPICLLDVDEQFPLQMLEEIHQLQEEYKEVKKEESIEGSKEKNTEENTEENKKEKIKSKFNNEKKELAVKLHRIADNPYPTIREAGGCVLLVAWGRRNGKLVEWSMQQLEKQNCKISGVIIYDARDQFLDAYYATTKFGNKNKKSEADQEIKIETVTEEFK